MTLRTTLRATLLVVPALLAACGKSHPQCEQFVELSLKCDDEMKSFSSGERKQVQQMMGGMCEEAFRNDTSSVSGETKQMVTEMYAELRERADCSAKANTCTQYDKCTENRTETN